MAKKEEKEKNLDIWLVMVILMLVLSVGGGLFITATTVISRLDALAVQTRSQVSTVETEVFELRKEVQNLEFMLKKQGVAKAAPATAEPAKAEPAKAEPAKAEPKTAPKKAPAK